MDDVRDEVPGDYKQAGLLMMISGGLQVMTGGFAVLMGFTTCLGTYGLCCFCPFLGIVPMAIGVNELVVGNQMYNGVRAPNAQSANLMGLISAVLMLSAVNVVLEALAMSMLAKPPVVAYLADKPKYEPIER